MVYKIKKNLLFFFGITIASAVSFFGNSFRTHFSKNESLVVQTPDYDVSNIVSLAHADGPPAGGCFPAGSPISTPTGDRAIEALVVGDLVYGFDISTGQKVTASVTKTFQHSWSEVHGRSPLLVVTHANGIFTVTANHWVYRTNKRDGEYANFDRANMLEIGDVLTLEDGTESAISKIEQGSEYDFVYNLTVEGVHTYFSGGVRVHNRNNVFSIPTASADDDDDGGGGDGGGGGGCDGSGSCDGGSDDDGAGDSNDGGGGGDK